MLCRFTMPVLFCHAHYYASGVDQHYCRVLQNAHARKEKRYYARYFSMLSLFSMPFDIR